VRGEPSLCLRCQRRAKRLPYEAQLRHEAASIWGYIVATCTWHSIRPAISNARLEAVQGIRTREGVGAGAAGSIGAAPDDSA
jgi:hypothetical protein